MINVIGRRIRSLMNIKGDNQTRAKDVISIFPSPPDHSMLGHFLVSSLVSQNKDKASNGFFLTEKIPYNNPPTGCFFLVSYPWHPIYGKKRVQHETARKESYPPFYLSSKNHLFFFFALCLSFLTTLPLLELIIKYEYRKM
jgi:hypothetical protein